MMRLLVAFAVVMATLGLRGQERTGVAAAAGDTVRLPVPTRFEPGAAFPVTGSGFLLTEEFMPEGSLPAFDFRGSLRDRGHAVYTFDAGLRPGVFLNRDAGSWAGPYGFRGTLFNQAVYRVSDKLVMGGSSYGLNRPFQPPLPGKGWSTRGASLFMEYRISNNIRIGTHVSVPVQP